MAINQASKYSQIVDERFRLMSVTQAAVNNDYDFDGVNTVNVYGIPTAPMNNYTMSGSQRYGVPAELQDTVQALTLSRDRSFTFAIDRRNYEDTMMVKEAGASLRRQIDEVVTPEIDIYRLATMAASAGNTETAAISNAGGAYEEFLKGTSTLLDNKAPLAGTVAFVSTGFYKAIRLDNAFILAGDLAQDALIKGQVGMIDGVPLVFVPNSYLPANTNYLLANRVAVTAPMKISEYKIHDNPPGINGWLIEGRVYYDCFVLANKANAIFWHKSA